MRPVLEYGSSVWDPHTHGLQEELEKVQNRAARFVTGNYVFETGSMTGILGQLKWESLKKRIQVGKDQDKAQSEKDSHSKNRGGKKNKLTIRYLYHETYRKPNEQLFSQ